uniref:Uncharacterized protein n=1 Tax=Arundo donax TaxID=35708 RepID=A0A0A9D431_ARUDO
MSLLRLRECEMVHSVMSNKSGQRLLSWMKEQKS